MSGVYSSQAQSALRLIARKGQLVTWKTLRSSAPPDPAKPWLVGTPTETSYAVSIVFMPPDKRDQAFLQAMTASDVPMGDVIGYMGAVGFTPALKDVVIRGGELYTVEVLERLAPNSETILWTIGFKR